MIVKEIIVVYYIYLFPGSNWKSIISDQLSQLANFALLDAAHLHIAICDCFNLTIEALELIESLVPKAVISIYHKNHFEYPGLKLVHDLAVKYPDKNFVYFHAKGVSHKIGRRTDREVTLLELTFKNWRKHIGILKTGKVSKIGLFPAKLNEIRFDRKIRQGWIWFNYWYATGSYLSSCLPPELGRDRYYYEGWIGNNGYGNDLESFGCYNIYQIPGKKNSYFLPEDADYFLEKATQRRLAKSFLKKLIYGPLPAALNRAFKIFKMQNLRA